MILKRHFPFYLLMFLILFSVGCGCFPPLMFGKALQVLKDTPTSSPTLTNISTPNPPFSEIKICSFVDDDGECIDASDQFPGGTEAVWIYFEYVGMKDGQTWRRMWELNGETYYDSGDDIWEDGAEGWLAYSLEEDYPLPPGKYQFTLFLGDSRSRTASFTVEKATNTQEIFAPAIGGIQFSDSIGEDDMPLGVQEEFDYGINKIYAFYPFINIPPGQSWACEWSFEGDQLVIVEGEWDNPSDGSTFCAYENNDRSELPSGNYTVNLYIGDQIARGATATVLNPDYERQEIPPADPEDIFAPELMEPWQMLSGVDNDTLQYIAQAALKYHVRMKIDDQMDWYGAVYHVEDCEAVPRTPGVISVQDQIYNDLGNDEIAAITAHELVHAVQHMEMGQCGCFIQNEVRAYGAQLVTLVELGRKDIVDNKWGFIYDGNGDFSQENLRSWILGIYDCPEYAP